MKMPNYLFYFLLASTNLPFVILQTEGNWWNPMAFGFLCGMGFTSFFSGR